MYQERELSRERQRPQENLASHFRKVIAGIDETDERYRLREAAEFLNQKAREVGVETRVSRTTFQKWVAITLGDIIKFAAYLPPEQLNSRSFWKLFPNERALPLSPTALCSYRGHLRITGNLNINDIRNVLVQAQLAYGKELNQEYSSAKKTIKTLREKCLPLQEIAQLLKGEEEYTESTYYLFTRFTRKLDQLILDNKLPLNNYPTLLARTIGIPREFFKKELERDWRETLSIMERKRILKRAEILSPYTLCQRHPEMFTSLTPLLRDLLEARNIKLQNKNVLLLAVYLKEKGIQIKSTLKKATGSTYYAFSREEREEIEKLLEDAETKKEIERIANQGFTLEEYNQTYRHHFPDEAPISITATAHLAGGPKTISSKRMIASIKNLLVREGIPLKERKLSLGKKEIEPTYVPIEWLAKAVSVLKEESSKNPQLLKSTRKETSSLKPVLFEILGFNLAPAYYSLIYDRHLSDIKGIDQVKLKKGYLYRVDKARLQAVIKSIEERREEILQAIREIKSSKV